MFLSDVSIKRPVFATMMMMALVVLGLFSYNRLPIDQWPDVSFPFIVVQTPYPGASPETVERDVTRKIEETVNPIAGVRNLTSSSLEGLSSVFIEFELKVNEMDAQQDVRAKIEQIRDELPRDVELPRVLRFDPQEIPIMSLALRSDRRSLRELTTLGDETLRKELEAVEGVGQVTLVGGEKRAVVVNLDPERLASRAVTVDQVMATLGAENMEVPAGRLELGPGEKLVRVAGRLREPADFDRLVVDVRDGVPIRKRARRPSSMACRRSASTCARSPRPTRCRWPTRSRPRWPSCGGSSPTASSCRSYATIRCGSGARSRTSSSPSSWAAS